MLTTFSRASAGDFSRPPVSHHLATACDRKNGADRLICSSGVPIGFGMIHDGRAADDAGVVDEDVHAPAVLDDLGDEIGGALFA